MAAGKNPYLRYRIINACLSSKVKRYWTKEEIMEKIRAHDLSVQARTLKYDLEHMRSDDRLGYHAPIGFCWRNKGYYYTDADYTIDQLRLSEEELKSLSFVREAIHPYADFSNAFQAAFQKVTRHHSLRDRPPVMYFESTPSNKGLGQLSRLYDAAIRKQPLRIHYQKFGDEHGKDHIYHPYFLKEYKKRWYALGWSERCRNTLTLALDRMKRIEEEAVAFRENTGIKPEEYFRQTLGVTVGKGPAEEIRLLFTPQQGHYIKTQPIHESQIILQDDADGLLIQLMLVVNFELIAFIQSYVPHVRVIGPSSLREQVMENLRKGCGEFSRQ